MDWKEWLAKLHDDAGSSFVAGDEGPAVVPVAWPAYSVEMASKVLELFASPPDPAPMVTDCIVSEPEVTVEPTRLVEALDPELTAPVDIRVLRLPSEGPGEVSGEFMLEPCQPMSPLLDLTPVLTSSNPEL